MKNFKYILVVPILCLMMILSCQTADELVPTTGNEITGLSFILPDGKKIDVALDISADNKIDIEIEDKVSTDMSKLRMLVNVPNNATVEAEVPMGTYMDFTKPVSFDVVGADGTRRTYTVTATLIATQIEIKELWKKTGSLMDFTQDNNRSVGFSGDYLVVHDRGRKGAYKYYNIETGEEAGVLSNEGVNMDPLHMISDDAGNIVSCSFTPGVGSELRVYWWNGVKAAPKQLLSWVSDITEKNSNIGRKLYVKGDMNKLAYLYATVSNLDMFLRWEIKDGVVTSDVPDKIQFIHPNGGWGYNGRVIPISVGKNSNYYINSNGKVRITYMNGQDNTPIYNSEDHIQDVFHQWLGGGHAFDYVNLSGSSYMFVIEQNGSSWMSEIFKLRTMMKDPSLIKDITSLIHTRKYNAWLEFPLDPRFGGKNGNVTGEVKARVSSDGKSAIVAFISTNGGVKVWRVSLA